MRSDREIEESGTSMLLSYPEKGILKSTRNFLLAIKYSSASKLLKNERCDR